MRIDERINLVAGDGHPAAPFLPDVGVPWEGAPSAWKAGESVGGVTVAEPVTVPLVMPEEERESFLEILHRPTRELITVVELLSPTNKAEPGHRDYLTKRNTVLRQPVHLVELDFLLGGKRLPMRRPLPQGDCYAIVSRYMTRPNAEVYAWNLRDPLPAIRIPLRAPDPDLVLNLAAAYEETFRRGRYGRSLRYSQPFTVPLEAVTAEWIAERASAQ